MGGGTEKARPRVVHVLEGGMLAAQARASQGGPGVPAETVWYRQDEKGPRGKVKRDP